MKVELINPIQKERIVVNDNETNFPNNSHYILDLTSRSIYAFTNK